MVWHTKFIYLKLLHFGAFNTHTQAYKHTHTPIHTHTYTVLQLRQGMDRGRKFIIACQIFLINYAVAKYAPRAKVCYTFFLHSFASLGQGRDKDSAARTVSPSRSFAVAFLIRGNHKRFLSTTAWAWAWLGRDAGLDCRPLISSFYLDGDAGGTLKRSQLQIV